jgi:hypothetical protein
MEFGAAVKSDSAGQLRGGVRCKLTPGGLSVQKGKSGMPVMIPRGAPARYDGGSRFSVDAGGRMLTLAVSKFGSYQQRIAREIAAYLSGARSNMPDVGEFKLEPYLLVVSILPFGIMAVTQGGAIWGAVGGVVAVGCLALAQAEQMPKAARLGLILLINVVVYAVVIAMVMAAKSVDPPSRY